MRKILLGTAFAVLFLCPKIQAESVSVSTYTATAIIPNTMFSTKSITLYSGTTQQIYLLGYPETSTTTWVNTGYLLTPSTITLTNWHGALYGCAPKAPSSSAVIYLGGQ